MATWKLDRPLAVFDIEATGTNTRADRIVEIAIVRLHPDGRQDSNTFRINPGIPIPPEATAVHGISDADVAACPRLAAVAPRILELLEGCDLVGYNCLRFDIPMLMEEFTRIGVPFEPDRYRVIDAQRIYHKREPRDLSAALTFYCGELHLGAHGAESDALATLRVLEGQIQKYSDLPRDMGELARYCDLRQPSWVDRAGRLKWANGEVVINFGRKKGTPLRAVLAEDASFAKWMLRSDFPSDTQEIVRNAMEGRWPVPPKPGAAEEEA